MDNLGIFLRRQTKSLLNSSIQQLKAGITAQLSVKFIPLYGEEKAGHLSSSVVDRCLLEEPGDMESKIFYQNHSDLIEAELLMLSKNETLAKALSWLYAAEILYKTPATKKSSSKRPQELAEQAARLNIHIPDTNEICGSAEINDCVIEIMKYAAEFYMENHPESGNIS